MFKLKKLLIFVVVLISLSVLIGALVYEYSGNSLSSGDFNWTFYNSSDGGFVQLNVSGSGYVEQGNYTSTIIDFGNVNTVYAEITWKGNGTCPYENMSYIDKLGGYCIDQYEAYNAGSTTAGSANGTTVWVGVSQTTAKTACTNAGKHLCTSDEWLGAANMQGKMYNLVSDLSASPYGCNVDSAAKEIAGNSLGCVSEEGVYDMVGNVWEWNAEVVDTVKPCNSGSSGYCYPQSDGTWGTSGDSYYGSDGVYFLANNNTGKAVQRGGFWDDGAGAGPFAVSLRTEPSDTYTAFGFRCCSEPS